MKVDDYVKIVAIDGNYRYGYISDIHDRGDTLGISLLEEGESKIAYDNAHDALLGQDATDWVSILTDIEKRIVPMLSAGFSTREIADEMSISPTTVRAHLRTLRIKLYLENRAQLVAFSQALAKLIEKQAGVDEAVKEWQNQRNT